jgi:hypothetical protein
MAHTDTPEPGPKRRPDPAAAARLAAARHGLDAEQDTDPPPRLIAFEAPSHSYADDIAGLVREAAGALRFQIGASRSPGDTFPPQELLNQCADTMHDLLPEHMVPDDDEGEKGISHDDVRRAFDWRLQATICRVLAVTADGSNEMVSAVPLGSGAVRAVTFTAPLGTYRVGDQVRVPVPERLSMDDVADEWGAPHGCP